MSEIDQELGTVEKIPGMDVTFPVEFSVIPSSMEKAVRKEAGEAGK